MENEITETRVKVKRRGEKIGEEREREGKGREGKGRSQKRGR